MNEDVVRQIIEETISESEISSDNIDDLVFSIKERIQDGVEDNIKEEDKSNVLSESDNVEELKVKIGETDDWREKAKISARIISQDLDY